MEKFSGLELLSVEACPVCRRAGGQDFVTRRDGISIRRCAECQGLFLAERPSDLAALYDGGYFALPEATAQANIGYQAGYTRLEDQLWQVGLTLAVSAILERPLADILDVGCATGQFLLLSRAFGATGLAGIELSAEAAAVARGRGLDVANEDIGRYRPVREVGIVTAWDVVEHLADPVAFVTALSGLIANHGLFCFSTPNADVPLASERPQDWKGFAHSFEHLFYLSSPSARRLLEPICSDVFLYPITFYGYDFLFGVGCTMPLAETQRELLSALVRHPERLIEAARAGEISALGACGLICLYAMIGLLPEAEALKEVVASVRDQVPPGIYHLTVGALAMRRGRVNEASDAFRGAALTPDLTEVALSAQTGLLNDYALDKESYVAHLLQEVARLQADLQQAQTEFGNYRLEMDAYRQDKETYISWLNERLVRLRWATWVTDLPGRVTHKLKRGVKRLIPAGAKEAWKRLGYEAEVPQPSGVTTLYAANPDLFAAYPFRVDLSRAERLQPVRGTLVTTVRNEAKSIGVWLDAILAQTRQPDELVIVDAGSTDGTIALLEQFAATAPFPVRVLSHPGANIARGRNLAIAAATHPIIACTDLGCHPEPQWLDNLLGPFGIDPATEVVAGWTGSHEESAFQRALTPLTVPRLDLIDPRTYLPSSRTVAFTRAAWERVGGYPEWLTFAGEDTLFAQRLKNQCPNWAFVPEAVVYWHMRTTWRAVYRQAYLYGMGDGESALFSTRYQKDIKHVAGFALTLASCLLTLFVLALGWWPIAVLSALGSVVLLKRSRQRLTLYLPPDDGQGRSKSLIVAMLGAILYARMCGFLQGVRNRPLVARRRYADTQGTCVIFSGVPIHDSGGGQRATQLALEFLDRGYRVVFVNQFPSYETVQLHLRIEHPHLELCPMECFEAEPFLASHDAAKPLIAIAEFPHPAFLAAMRPLQARGAKLVYDLIDDWRSSLGGTWYSTDVEHAFMSKCDLLVASAQTLVERLRSESGRQVTFVPNAVNLRLFHRGHHPKPADMVTGAFTVTYIGALWGEWFDWDQLIHVARTYPQASVVVIGDYHGQSPVSLPNLHFLGLKPQRELPAYLAYSDVALIPFKLSDLTQAVSPLKIFEYLAMGVPVVSSPLKEVLDMPYVLTGQTPQEFSERVGQAAALQVDPAVVERFIHANAWSERVDRIMGALGLPGTATVLTHTVGAEVAKV